jgi:DNA-binding SARP family transcriptional activator
MQLHAAMGDRAAVAHQYRACAKILADGFGVAPDAETTTLYESLMRGKAAEQPHGVILPTGAADAV